MKNWISGPLCSFVLDFVLANLHILAVWMSVVCMHVHSVTIKYTLQNTNRFYMVFASKHHTDVHAYAYEVT